MRILVILTILLTVNLSYGRTFWREFWTDTPVVEARFGEVLAAEMSMEQVYLNIKDGQSPFSNRRDEFYPFGTSFTTTDPGNGIFFSLLRPWLSTHRAMLLISMFSLFMASLGMYILLRLLKIQTALALILGLAFGYTTFLLPRAGHLTYFSIYVFPWFFVAGYLALYGRQLLTRLAGSALAGVVLVLSLYHNSYYFVTLGLINGLLSVYYLMYRRGKIVAYLQTRSRELVVFLLVTMISLAPWMDQVGQDRLFEGLPVTKGWGGAIEYSSDLFGYFIPSPYSRYLQPISAWMDAHFTFARGIFENYSYPGMLFLGTFAVLGYLFWRKQMPRKVSRTIAPLLFATFWIWILTLGPFLHVGGRWSLGLLEEIKLVIPLPFALFHYLPFMENIRSPARLAIGFIFVGYIVVAYMWQWLWTHSSKTKQSLFLALLSIIFIFDHSLRYTPATKRILPIDHYRTIREDPKFGTVLEIPSTIRDGFTYFGSGDNLDFIAGQMIHRKPIVNGYIGRLPAYKIAYTQNNPFLGYVGRLTDPDPLHNGGFDRTTLPSWTKIDLDASKDAIDLLDLKYLILATEAPYNSSMAGTLTKLGYEQLEKNSSTSLWRRTPSQREFLEVAIGLPGDDFMLAGDWYGRDRDFRWMRDSAQILFKVIEPRKLTLHLTGESYYRPQEIDVYVNRQKVGTLPLTTTKTTHTLNIPPELFSTGVTIVHLIATQSWQPIVVDPQSADTNFLAAQFWEAYLK